MKAMDSIARIEHRIKGDYGMNHLFRRWAAALMLNLIMAIYACALRPTDPASLTPIRIQLTWTHSAQFAGFYAADQNGDYAAEGLAVTFLEGGLQVERLPPVLEGQAQFGLGGAAELITARAEGQPVHIIATIFQRDPFAFFSLADSGITRPDDFKGKTIQIRPRARPFLRAMTHRVGLAPGQYTENNEAEFTDLYTGEVDVATGFVTAQYIEASQAGYDLNVIYPDDYGVHFYTDLIFTTDEFVAANPELITRFLRATLAGWRYAVEHPAEASTWVLKYNPAADAVLEDASMAASLPLINTGQDNIGWMKPEDWDGMVQLLREQGVLTKPVEVTHLYSLQILQEIYEP
jgi:NitT/TauT family transport system substrate-binding protein